MFSERAAPTAQSLLAPPSTEASTFARVPVSTYANCSQHFRLAERSFNRQYAHIYATRLVQMRPLLLERARQKWGSSIAVKKLCELQVAEKCCIVGTLFKSMQLQPSILREISEERLVLRPPPAGRLAWAGSKTLSNRCLRRCKHCGGGRDSSWNCFHPLSFVNAPSRAHCFPPVWCLSAALPRQLPRSGPSSDRFVLLVSGLGLGGGSGESSLGMQLLVDVVTGQLGAEGEQNCAAQISRVILAGNLLSQNTQNRDTLHKHAGRHTAMGQSQGLAVGLVLGEAAEELARGFPILQLGERQRRMACLCRALLAAAFPLASAYSTLQLVTNPYQANIDGVRFLGTSGQNISDIFKYSSMEDYLEILEWTVRGREVLLTPWGQGRPACYPFYKTDPFIFSDCPHVYFCGNAPGFQAKELTGADGQQVLLVTVPDFSATQTACLVNLRSPPCQPISFSGFGAEDSEMDGPGLGP
uniref:DNA polymerase delta subunit 2 n=1 Tax=Pelodiscus sinensis TaxID=13735 RepID=K7FH43_PELSI